MAIGTTVTTSECSSAGPISSANECWACNEGYIQAQGACHKTGQACAKEDLAKISAYATAGTKLMKRVQVLWRLCHH